MKTSKQKMFYLLPLQDWKRLLISFFGCIALFSAFGCQSVSQLEQAQTPLASKTFTINVATNSPEPTLTVTTAATISPPISPTLIPSSTETLSSTPALSPTVIPPQARMLSIERIVRVTMPLSGDEATIITDDFTFEPPVISADGRYVAFATRRGTLIENDTNAINDYSGSDVFLHDTETGTTKRISVGENGEQAEAESYQPSISGDGRYIVFTSALLVDGQVRGGVYLYDQVESHIKWIANGSEPVISLDGSTIAFTAHTGRFLDNNLDNTKHVIVYDIVSDSAEIISVNDQGEYANGSSYFPSLSAEGNLIGFATDATNLVTIENGDLMRSAVAYNRETQQFTLLTDKVVNRVAVHPDGEQVAYELHSGSIGIVNLLTDERHRFKGIYPSLSFNDELVAVTKSPQGFAVFDLVTYESVLEFELGSLAVLSANGNAIAFFSSDSTIMGEDMNEAADIFVAFLSR